MMAYVPQNQPLQMSVIDRLCADEDGWSSDPVLSDLRSAVRRDLENLLNTRWRNRSFPDDLKDELDTSLVNYGIPDPGRGNLSSDREKEDFRRFIERVIRRYEPRLDRVRIERLENTSKFDRTFRFRVVGVLRVKPSPEEITFDTTLEPTTATFHVEPKH